jgi:hypothetical protein
MGCQNPLTGADKRHHPGENFEKPFGSCPLESSAAIPASAWVGWRLAARL